MEATQAQQSPHSEAAAASPQPGVSSSSGTALQPTRSTGILDLPDDLVERIHQEALTKDPSAFKQLLLVCRSWAASAPVNHLHPRIHEGVQIPGALLAEGMARLSGVVSLRLPRKSVRGLLPTINTPSGAAEDPSRHQAQWTVKLESLTMDHADHVEFAPADFSLAFPKLTELSLAFSGERALPQWMKASFPQNLRSLRLHRMPPEVDTSVMGSIPTYGCFPASLVSLHLSCLGPHFISSSFGELARLKCLTFFDCAFVELPESIGNLQQLKHLTIDQCSWLASLPESISNLVSLSSLRLLHNKFNSLPDLGPHLQQSLLVFQHLDYYNFRREGPLEGFPSDLGFCLNIRTLHLQSGDMKRIPNLEELKYLQDLLLDLPELTELSDVFSAMPSLKSVKLLCNRLFAVPPSLTASTSSSLEVLHILCEDTLVLPSLTCPQNLLELKLVGRIVGSPQADTAVGTPAHHHPSQVTLNPAIKKVHVTSCHVRVEVAGTSLEELALSCDKKSCHDSGKTHGDIWGEGEVPALPSLTKVILWCGDEDQHCYHSWITRLAPLPGLRALQIAPHTRCLRTWRPSWRPAACTTWRLAPLGGWHRTENSNAWRMTPGIWRVGPLGYRHVEAGFSPAPEGHLHLETLRLQGPDLSILSSLPSLLTGLCAAGSVSGIPDLLSDRGALTGLRDLVLSNLTLTEAPDFLEELRGLVSFTVSRCYELRKLNLPPTWTSLVNFTVQECSELSQLNLPPTWTSLESLHISGCPNLRSRGDMLDELLSLKTLVLGCSLMVEDPPSLQTLQQLTSFEVVEDCRRCGDHVCQLPLSLWSLPSLRRIKATVGCLRELPNVPIPPSVESLDLGKVGRFLCLPRAEGSGLPWHKKKALREAREQLGRRRKLRTGVLPLHWDLLTQLTSLHVFHLIRSPSGLHLPSNLTMLTQLTHFKVTESGMDSIPPAVASLPHLLKLELRHCRRLKVIHGASDGYHALQEITIEDCPLLEAWPDVVTNR